MLIRAGYEIAIECQYETPLMALLSVHPSRAQDLRTPAVIMSNGRYPLVGTLDDFGKSSDADRRSRRDLEALDQLRD